MEIRKLETTDERTDILRSRSSPGFLQLTPNPTTAKKFKHCSVQVQTQSNNRTAFEEKISTILFH